MVHWAPGNAREATIDSGCCALVNGLRREGAEVHAGSALGRGGGAIGAF
jgi:hypothetical protein